MDPTRLEIDAFLKRVRHAVEREQVFVTHYAAERAAEELEWDHWDIIEQLRELHQHDHLRCEASKVVHDDLVSADQEVEYRRYENSLTMA